MRNILKRLFSIILIAISGVTQAQLKSDVREQLVAGNIRLGQGFKNWFRPSVLTDLYLKGEWERLAERVIHRNFGLDIDYFYLGRVAEEMGSKQVAILYYRLAESVSQKCRNEDCNGLNVSKEAAARLSFLNSGVSTTLAGGTIRYWPLETGPRLGEIIASQPTPIDRLLTSPRSIEVTKGKFETEEEFSVRRTAIAANLGDTFLLTFPIRTDRPGFCDSSYDHSKKKYQLKNCQLISPSLPVASETKQGDPLILSNMMDQREVKRLQSISYYIDVSHSWSGELDIDRSVAAQLDQDLFFAIAFKAFNVVSSCTQCQSREARESFASAAGSLAAIQGRPLDTSNIDWKREAFLKGQIQEDWTHKFSLSQIRKVVIFRKSDSRVLYEYSVDRPN